MAHNPVLDQQNFQFYEPGTESGAASIAAQDTDIDRQTGTGNAFQIRIALNESGSVATGGATYKLRVSKNSGSYVNVTASSSDVQVTDDSNITDDAATTNRLTVGGGGGSFVTGRFDDVDGSTTSNVNVTGGDWTELLWSIYIVDADVANNDTLDFRVYDSDDTVISGSYNITPRVTVDASGDQTVVPGLATETDTALSVTPLPGSVSVIAGLASETDTALAVSVGVGVLVGLASETDSALSVTPLPGSVSVVPGLANETDSALVVTPLPGSVSVVPGLASETDTALVVTPSSDQTVAVGLAQETDTALPVDKVTGALLPTANLEAHYVARLGVLLNAGVVETWNDQSGNAHHATQPTAAKRPIVTTIEDSD